MTQATTDSDDFTPWSEEPTDRQGINRVRAHIGGLHCSLCTGTIERALGSKTGVKRVAVSLTHEQALVEYDSTQANARDLMGTLQQIGYTLSDPRKVEPFERQEKALAIERLREAGSLAFSHDLLPVVLSLLSRLLKKASCLFQNTKSKKCDFYFSCEINGLPVADFVRTSMLW